MKKTNLFVTLGLTALLSTGLALPAIAVDPTPQEKLDAAVTADLAAVTKDNVTATDNKTTAKGDVAVNVETETPIVKVTVPTKLPIYFGPESAGTATVPTNFKIKNDSVFDGIAIKKATVTSGSAGGWTVVDTAPDTTNKATNNVKNLQFKIGTGANKALITAANGVTFASTDTALVVANAKAAKADPAVEKVIDFEIKGPKFTTSQTIDNAYNMSLEFDWASNI